MWRVRRRSAGEAREGGPPQKLVQNLPYLLIGLYATKLSQAWRLAAGNDASEKLLHYSAGLSEAFQSPLPSFAVHDLLFGAAVGLLLALVVLEKRRNRKSSAKEQSMVQHAGERHGTLPLISTRNQRTT